MNGELKIPRLEELTPGSCAGHRVWAHERSPQLVSSVKKVCMCVVCALRACVPGCIWGVYAWMYIHVCGVHVHVCECAYVNRWHCQELVSVIYLGWSRVSVFLPHTQHICQTLWHTGFWEFYLYFLSPHRRLSGYRRLSSESSRRVLVIWTQFLMVV